MERDIAMKKYKTFLILGTILTLFLIFLIWGNDSIEITELSYDSKKIPIDFEGFTIVQISDLHNKRFGKQQSSLLNKIQSLNPDIIILTGDLVDSSYTNLESVKEFILPATAICPVYYVTGNHEAWIDQYAQLETVLTNASVILMDNRKIELTRNQSKVELYGISDPLMLSSTASEEELRKMVTTKLKDLSHKSNPNTLKILLSHRPGLLDIFSDTEMDLVFSGHVHGGQFRLPFLGGLIGPNKKILPKFTSGFYYQGNTTMVVSRGLGNSVIPIRFLNRPEIISLTLKRKN